MIWVYVDDVHKMVISGKKITAGMVKISLIPIQNDQCMLVTLGVAYTIFTEIFHSIPLGCDLVVLLRNMTFEHYS